MIIFILKNAVNNIFSNKFRIPVITTAEKSQEIGLYS